MKLPQFILADGSCASPAKGAKIPWDDPDFSRRMLEQHLSQDHDWASRRAFLIARHTAWIAAQLGPGPARVLDLACGPGFYAQALAALGHSCTGVDFSPASIDYARQEAGFGGLAIEYILDDIRNYRTDRIYDCILLTFGEFNVFTREDAAAILKNCATMLAENGLFLLETHTYAAVRASGEAAPSWQRQRGGLFSDDPYLCLQENSWNENDKTAFSNYWIIDAPSAAVSRYASFMQAYTEEEYRRLFRAVGLEMRQILDDATWPAGEMFRGQLQVFVLKKHSKGPYSCVP